MIVTTEGFTRFTSGAKLIGKHRSLVEAVGPSTCGDDAVTVGAAIGFADAVDELGVGAVSR